MISYKGESESRQNTKVSDEDFEKQISSSVIYGIKIDHAKRDDKCNNLCVHDSHEYQLEVCVHW